MMNWILHEKLRVDPAFMKSISKKFKCWTWELGPTDLVQLPFPSEIDKTELINSKNSYLTFDCSSKSGINDEDYTFVVAAIKCQTVDIEKQFKLCFYRNIGEQSEVAKSISWDLSYLNASKGTSIRCEISPSRQPYTRGEHNYFLLFFDLIIEDIQ